MGRIPTLSVAFSSLLLSSPQFPRKLKDPSQEIKGRRAFPVLVQIRSKILGSTPPLRTHAPHKLCSCAHSAIRFRLFFSEHQHHLRCAHDYARGANLEQHQRRQHFYDSIERE